MPSPSVLTNGILHAPLQVSARQVVFTDIHVGHGCVLQLLGEGFPGLQADLKILPSIQGPDAALLQDLRQPQELLIKHALQDCSKTPLKIKQLLKASRGLSGEGAACQTCPADM